ncbi:MAG: hypothetical protein Q9187_002315 [Circinaria calcarea]
MPRPLQCVYYCSRSDERTNVIFAASVSSILSFSASDGSLLFSWPREKKSDRSDDIVSTNLEFKAEVQETITEPPGKRLKVSSSGNVSESTSTEIVVENDWSKRRKPRAYNSLSPSVIKLLGTSDGKYLIAVTGEDKCIRVFGIHKDSSLETISERHMPKRPCSVILTTDERTIVCADKFGDVYALPLKITSPTRSEDINGSSLDSEIADVAPEQKLYVPAASLSTVHTKRNQQALRNQQIMANKVAEKKILGFDHELILGHVSLLTDITYVTIKPQESGPNQLRNYIITSDRDEHIRVSRGLPQAHIIEGYCLGHTEFISKICVPFRSPETLVSGGGDDFLLVWDWITGSVRQKINLKATVEAATNKLVEKVKENGSTPSIENQTISDSGNILSIAVSGIWDIHISTNKMGDDLGELIVACEGQVVYPPVIVKHANLLLRIPALFIYGITSSHVLEFRQCLLVEGNVLDVAILQGQRSFLVTMDNVHVPLTTTVVENAGNRPALAAFSYDADSRRWVEGHDFESILLAINDWAALRGSQSAQTGSEDSLLSDLLYGIENLRKRGREE